MENYTLLDFLIHWFIQANLNENEISFIEDMFDGILISTFLNKM